MAFDRVLDCRSVQLPQVRLADLKVSSNLHRIFGLRHIDRASLFLSQSFLFSILDDPNVWQPSDWGMGDLALID